jgi:TatD DNase family protein
MYIDTHAHLSFPELAGELPRVLERAYAAGVTQMISVGTTLADSRVVVELAGRCDGVWAAVGLHPGDVPESSLTQMPALRALAASPKVVAIGETGLDYYREAKNDPVLREQQTELFRAQLELARELKLPVIIHNRSADEEMLAMLRAFSPSIQPWGVMHCFSSDVQFALACIELGLLISYTGILTFKNATQLHEVAGRVGLEHVMLETDSPYLAPVPHRGKRNEPSYIPLIAQMLAAVKGVDVAEIAHITTANAVRLFRLSNR